MDIIEEIANKDLSNKEARAYILRIVTELLDTLSECYLDDEEEEEE
jgi:hypothetical protein